MFSTIKKFSIVFVSLILLQCSEQTKENHPEQIDPAKTFKEFITKHLDGYKNHRRERVTLLGGGWVNEYFEPEKSYKIDVQKTNSLITPFTGFCEFTLTRHITAFHKSKDAAALDKIVIKSDQTVHKHYYGFQENEWIVTSREHQKISTSPSNWYDCNEILQAGEQKGLTNLEGCWEDYY